jgi:hypothetical protein
MRTRLTILVVVGLPLTTAAMALAPTGVAFAGAVALAAAWCRWLEREEARCGARSRS